MGRGRGEEGEGEEGWGRIAGQLYNFLCLGYGMGQMWGENFSLDPPPLSVHN